MAGWFSKWLVGAESTATVEVCGKSLEVRCSASAERALSGRISPLIVELELAFACFARKEIRFREMSKTPLLDGSLVWVRDQLALQVSTVVSDFCQAGAPEGTATKAPIRSFVPRWVRIDHARGKWIGEYGL